MSKRFIFGLFGSFLLLLFFTLSCSYIRLYEYLAKQLSVPCEQDIFRPLQSKRWTIHVFSYSFPIALCVKHLPFQPEAVGGCTFITQRILDGSASKPALRQDTGYNGWENLPWYWTIFGGFWGLFNASVTHIWFKWCFHIQKQSLNEAVNSRYIPSGQKTISFGQKRP